MSDVIFEVTKEHLETGLRGYPVGYCTTSSVDPEKGLYYCGRPISELAHWKPLQVIYLLKIGKKGSESEVADFEAELAGRAHCSDALLDAIGKLPKGHPMDLFSVALMLCRMLEGKRDYEEDCLNLIAKVPQIAAAVINHHAGRGAAVKSDPSLGYMENFSKMIGLADSSDVFSLFNILHYDHGGGNLSTFVGKAISSSLEDLYGSIAGAMNALAGPRHGRANQDCLEFVRAVLDQVGEDASATDVEALIRERLANKELVFGFGHAVLRVEDPRATVLYEMAHDRFGANPLVKIATLLREVGPKVLAENPKISNPYPNVDAISGTVLSAAGFPHPEYYTVLFGLARSVGIALQIVYERTQAREGKGVPIYRPKYFYKGA